MVNAAWMATGVYDVIDDLTSRADRDLTAISSIGSDSGARCERKRGYPAEGSG